MLDGGKGWEKAVHMPPCVTYVTEEHLFVGIKPKKLYSASCVGSSMFNTLQVDGLARPEHMDFG